MKIRITFDVSDEDNRALAYQFGRKRFTREQLRIRIEGEVRAMFENARSEYDADQDRDPDDYPEED